MVWGNADLEWLVQRLEWSLQKGSEGNRTMKGRQFNPDRSPETFSAAVVAANPRNELRSVTIRRLGRS